MKIKTAPLGTVSQGTLKTDDLLESFASELEWQIRNNGEYFSQPENFALRDKLNALHGTAIDQWNDDGETLQDDDVACELIGELQDALSEHFAAPYCYFGAHAGDGADFGFWPDWDSISDLPNVESVEDGIAQSDDAYSTDFRIVNDHGNTTVYGSDGSVLLELV